MLMRPTGRYQFRTPWTRKTGYHPSGDHNLMNPLCICNPNQRKSRPRRSMIFFILKNIDSLINLKPIVGTSIITDIIVLATVMSKYMSINKIIELNTREIQKNTPTNISWKIMSIWNG